MPHGGYHGVVKVGDTIVQQGSRPDGQGGQTGGGVYNPQGFATEIAGSPAPSTTESIEKQIEDKKKEIGLHQGFQIEGDTAKGLATLRNIKNQQLNNLLRQQQEENLRRSILSSAGKGVLNKSDLTGFEGGVLGIRTGDFEDVPAATVINPFTGEKIVTDKAREGLSTPEYNKFIQQLYATNPELYEERFPVASGNLVQPILARLLEGGLGGVGQGVASFIDSATGAIFKPAGGTVTPSDVSTPSDTGGVTSVIDAPKANNNPFSIPSAFTGFYESDFYNPNAVGGKAVTPVTLPDGTVVRFPNTAIGGQFRQYLESLGISQPPATGVDVVKSQPTGISKFDVDKFYASLPQYTQQGIMAPTNLSRFTDALRMFPGATV